MNAHIKPDAGGIVRAGVQEPGKVYLAAQRFEGTSTAEMDLDPTEARLIGRMLIKAADQAGKMK